MRIVDAKTGIEVMDHFDCRRLLEEHAGSIGRIAVADGSHPVILPINYAMDDGVVVFRTGSGTKLHGALAHAAVAFEIDGVDDVGRGGWSVLVKGTAEHVTVTREVERLEGLGLEPWSGAVLPDWVAIRRGSMSGRLIRPRP